MTCLDKVCSAISLKGDLALALLPADKPAAAAEIRGLADIAREALGDIRRIVRADRPVSLRAEIDGATALLVAAGVNSSIDAALDDLEMPVDELFGWVAREGVTNLLRHSQASSCSIVAGRELGRLYLQITNDGARGSRGSGTGIAGLSDRAALLSGHLRLRARQRRSVPPPCRGLGDGAVIRVLIAEDMQMIREALVALLSREDDLEIVAELERGDEVLRAPA